MTDSGDGFAIDAQTGQWQSQQTPVADQDDADPDAMLPLTGVKLYVQDTRNILLIKPTGADADSPVFLTTLACALSRGIQMEYQVEDNEVEAELIGCGAEQRILLWEAAEGGTGVAEALLNEPWALGRVARRALAICHFDPDTGQQDAAHNAADCVAACYQCLMSYGNQREHELIDRHSVRDYLYGLTCAETRPDAAGRTREEHYHWLLERVDPASTLEKDFLRYLFDNGYQLPSAAQYRLGGPAYVQADFYYEPARAGIFIDGPAHDSPAKQNRAAEQRAELEDMGYQVVVIRHSKDFGQQVAAFPSVFGSEARSNR